MARSGIIYGNSGSYKTTAVKHFARYIYEVTGKNTLLFSMDGGGWEPCTPEVIAGVISPYRCTMVNPLPMIRKMSQGYWPEDPTQISADKLNMIPVDWNKFGGIAVEGLTSISNALMRLCQDKALTVGNQRPDKFGQRILVSGEVLTEEFASATQAHYKFVQDQIFSMIMNLAGMPCNYALFTALESRTEDDDRSTLYGPQIVGKKATNQASSWVGDCIHSQDYAVERVVKTPDPHEPGKMIETPIMDTVVRSYFKKHPDPSTGLLFPAKPRVTPEMAVELEKVYPGGYYTPTPEYGFDRYMHEVDKLQSGKAVDSVRAWREAVDQKHGRGKPPEKKLG